MEPWQVLLLVLGIVLFILLIVVVSNIKIVKQTDKYIIERMGAYYTTWGVGIHMLIPFFDKVAS